MAVTPLVAPFRLQINYVSDVTHKMQILCAAHVTGGAYVLEEFGGGTQSLSAFTGALVTLLKPMFDAASQFQDYVLQEYVGGAYVPRAEGSIGVSGTNAGALVKAAQTTHTFFDHAEKRVRMRFLGAANVSQVQKLGYAALGPLNRALVDDLLNASTGHLGAIFMGRAAQPIASYITQVDSYNRKSRRRLGVV